MKILIKIIKAILNIMMSLIIIFGLAFVGLYIFKVVPYVVESGSMEPAIQTGSVCFINENYDYEEIKKGDIIAFKFEDKTLATHRVVNVSDKGIETKGDANDNSDGITTTKDNYVGKNVFSIPKVGYAVKLVQSTRGKIIFGTIIVVIFLAGLLLGEESKPKKREGSEE